MSTLYRDYRPQTFADLIGQNHIKIALQNEVGSEQASSAYLFCGPRAVGKTTTARILAKAVNCENRHNGDYEPCNHCPSCLSITEGHNLDVIEIDAASNTGVDNVRENIIAFSRLAPSRSKFKVFIIDEVHMLSLSAFNALLKIIEEPPAYVMFILCTTEIQKVPATVVSRCERYDFKRISVKDIVGKLARISKQEKIEVDNEVLEAVARRSGGHLRDAESLLGQIFALGDQKITREQAELVLPHYNSNEAVDLLNYLSHKDAAKSIALVNSLMDSGVNLKSFTIEVIELLRKIMLNKLSPELSDKLGLDLGENLEHKLLEASADLDFDRLVNFIEKFLKVSSDYKQAAIPQLPLELAITELCLDRPLASLEANPPSNSGPTRSKKEPLIKMKPVKNKKITSDPSYSNLSLSEAEISSKWLEFLVKIKKYNHSLSFVLQNCRPQELKKGRLLLVFKYKFHKDRINDPSIKNIVENTLAEVFGQRIGFTAVIDENLNLKSSSLDNSNEPIKDVGQVSKETNKPVSTKKAGAVNVRPDNPASGLLSDLLDTFGGEVVN